MKHGAFSDLKEEKMVAQLVRRRATRAVVLLAVSALSAAPAAAQCLQPAPPSHCPAPYIPPIVMPRAETPPTERPPDQRPPEQPITMPQTPPTEAQAAPEQAGAFGSEVASIAMVGDSFGSGGSLSSQMVGPGRLNGATGQLNFFPSTANGLTGSPAVVIHSPGGSSTISLTALGTTLFSIPNNGSVAPPITIAQSIPSLPPPGSSVTFTGNAVTIAAINATLNSPNVKQQFVLPGILRLEQQLDPTVVGISSATVNVPGTGTFSATSSSGSTTTGTLSYDTLFTTAVLRQVLLASAISNAGTAFIPSPSAGGVVGRVKTSEDNSPLPRDRVFFTYDYFNSVPTAANNDVRRYTPGFEKTFFDRNASIEFRFPFASTVSSDINLDSIASSTRTQFGNMDITLKGLLYGTDRLYVASGLSLTVPTGDDVRVSMGDGTNLIRIKNEAVLLTPYIAALAMPTERIFAQTWFQIGFDANGNGVSANLAGTGLQGVGRLNEQQLLQVDTQLGYFLYRASDPGAWVRSIAPYVELHYNSTLGGPDKIALGGFFLGDTRGSYSELNLTSGFISQVRDNFTMSFGVVAPLRSSDNRSFDYQIGLRANYFFGPTSRSRNEATSLSSF
ncbi:MAG: hypothetical protein HYS12_19415 [Planctomycetes bacterium]|nr:hypothetical protein [Planctomycetota bacterium]